MHELRMRATAATMLARPTRTTTTCLQILQMYNTSKPGTDDKSAHADQNFIPLHGTRYPCGIKGAVRGNWGRADEGWRKERLGERKG